MDEEILYLCCRIHNVCCNCHPSWCHICHTTSQSIQLQPRQCTLDHCTMCHSISIHYQTRSLVLGGPKIKLTGWVDSDWGACTDTHHSMSSYAFSLGSGLVSWSSKKQPTIVSSTKAEYIASCYCVKEAMWLQSLVKSLGHAQDHSS